MSEVSGRLWAGGTALSRSTLQVPEPADRAKGVEVFGSNTFDVSAMKEKLPKPVFKSLQETIRRGSRLDPAIAHEAGPALKRGACGGPARRAPPIARGGAPAIRGGARGRGGSHFCHWFQPQTGLTAEKHD